jgi:hypothetical protein
MADTAEQKHLWYIAKRDRQRVAAPVKERQPERIRTPKQRDGINARRRVARHAAAALLPPKPAQPVASPTRPRTIAEAQAAEANRQPSAEQLATQAGFEKVIRAAIVSGTIEHGRWFSETGESEEILARFDASPPSFLEGRQAFIVPLPKTNNLESPRL